MNDPAQGKTRPWKWTVRRRWATAMLLIAPGLLQQDVAAAPVEFERDIRPILARHCWKCHGPEKQQSGLRLDVKSQAFQGGNSNEPAVVPLNAGQSRLLRLVTSQDKDERMPPEGDGLSDGEIEKLRRWIDGGAVWPESAGPIATAPKELVVTEDDRNHWSFRPFQSIAPPAVRDENWVRTPIDRFILHALEEKGLTPNPPADSRTLVRRACFDLIGLPPQWRTEEGTLKESWSGIELANNGPTRPPASAALARLLASPHFGERWARHWLDVARYADSNGQEGDADRPHAYRFRDFVIRAINEDMPYDQFVRWQLAGDELAPDVPDAIAATGFIVAGNSTNLNVPMEEEKLRNRANELDDMVSTTGQALLGLTLGCCRCHDHKYDPLPTRDYYRLMRVFNGGDRSNVPLAPPAEVRQHQQAMAMWQKDYDVAVGRRDEWLREASKPVAGALLAARVDKLPIDAEEKRRLIETPEDPAAKKLASRFKKELAIPDAEYVAALSETEQSQWRVLEEAVQVVAKRKPAPLPVAFAFADFAPEPRETWFFERGDFLARNEKMDLGFLTVLMRGKTADEYWNAARREKLRDDSTQQRRALAEWITDVEHGGGTLLARVMVNRVWQHHFGEGLVRTPNDFGTRGERPTHPELLEWLSAEFVRSGWSLKQLHEWIVNSATYQQASTFDATKATVDPDNRLLWRYRPRRLEAELLRDAMLASAGTLNLQRYGPSVKPPIVIEAMQARNVKDPYPRDARDTPETRRRTIYLFHKRVVQYPLLQAFDAPDAQVSCGRRVNTTVAPQALALLNDPFVRARAVEMAQSVAQEAGENLDRQIRLSFQRTLAREPTREDLEDSLMFVHERSSARREQDQSLSESTATLAAMTDLCQALFGLNEFIYVD